MNKAGATRRTLKHARGVTTRQLPALLMAAFIYGVGFLAGFEATGLSGEFRRLAAVEPESFWVFVGHNVPALLLTAAGALTAGLLTLFLLLFNGMLLGFVFGEASRNDAIGDALAAVLPHAPPELTAVWLAGTVGLMPISVVIRLALGRTVYVRREFLDAGLLLTGAVAFLILAASVEASITPWIINQTVGGR